MGKLFLRSELERQFFDWAQEFLWKFCVRNDDRFSESDSKSLMSIYKVLKELHDNQS
jgi:hypothetical protein